MGQSVTEPHCSWESLKEAVNQYSNALANITRRLIGQCQKVATAYSAIYRRKPDVMSNVVCDWST